MVEAYKKIIGCYGKLVELYSNRVKQETETNERLHNLHKRLRNI